MVFSTSSFFKTGVFLLVAMTTATSSVRADLNFDVGYQVVETHGSAKCSSEDRDMIFETITKPAMEAAGFYLEDEEQGIWKWEGDYESAEDVLETKAIATDAMVSQLAKVRVENSSGIECIDSIEPEMELFTEWVQEEEGLGRLRGQQGRRQLCNQACCEYLCATTGIEKYCTCCACD